MRLLKILPFIMLSFGIKAQNIDWEFYSTGQGGNTMLEQALDIAPTNDGGYIVTGQSGSSIFLVDLYIEKLDSAGNSDWSKIYYLNHPGIDNGNEIKQLADSNYIIVGSWNKDTISVDLQLLIMKIDSIGDTLWTKTYGGPNNDNGNDFDITSDGGLIIAGNYRQASFNSDYYLLRTDANGDTLWTKTYGGGGHDFARSVQETSDGDYIMAGTTRSFGPSGSGLMGNIWLVKTDANGDTLWTTVIGSVEEEAGNKVIQTQDGGYAIVGRTGNTSLGEREMYLAKTDSMGVLQWDTAYVSTLGNDEARDIIQRPDGGYLITGSRMEPHTFDRPTCIVMRTDAMGDVLWEKLLPTTGNSPNGGDGYAISATADGGCVVAGGNDIGTSGLDMRAYVAKLDDTTKADTTSGIKRLMTSKGLLVYPNPATDIIYFTTYNKGTVEVYGLDGRVLISTAIRVGSNELDISTLPQGIYVLKVSTAGGTMVRKVVVE